MTWRPAADAVVRAVLGELGAGAGVYLHGSAALGGWLPGQSDVDLLVVVEAEPPADRLEAFAKAVCDAPGSPVELSVVTAGLVRSPEPPWPFLLHVNRSPDAVRVVFGAEHRGDPDLLMHCAVTRAAGVALCGPPAAEVFGDAPRDVVRRYLIEELEWGLREASEHYVVLNACRALAYDQEGWFLSKQDGATWARYRLGAHEPLITQVLLERQQALTDPSFSPGWERRPGRDAHALVAHVIRCLSAGSA